jgi:hypothetical protein
LEFGSDRVNDKHIIFLIDSIIKPYKYQVRVLHVFLGTGLRGTGKNHQVENYFFLYYIVYRKKFFVVDKATKGCIIILFFLR